jgi:CopG antitoxin of type II toxin-antitoxin system
MGNKTRRMSIDEVSEFWDTHSVADVTSHDVEIEYSPSGHTTLVAVEDHLLERLSESARQRGVSVETLVNLWLQEKLTA